MDGNIIDFNGDFKFSWMNQIFLIQYDTFFLQSENSYFFNDFYLFILVSNFALMYSRKYKLVSVSGQINNYLLKCLFLRSLMILCLILF